MNYDDLISRYIDGELNQEEDNILRSEIAQNPSLKSAFDDAIYVHCAMKSDAEVLKVPEDLKLNTQDLVSMKIFRDSQQFTYIQSSRARAKNFAMAVAAVVIFGFSYISDYPALKHISKLLSYQQNESISTKASNISTNSISTDLFLDDKSSNKISDNKIKVTKNNLIGNSFISKNIQSKINNEPIALTISTDLNPLNINKVKSDEGNLLSDKDFSENTLNISNFNNNDVARYSKNELMSNSNYNQYFKNSNSSSYLLDNINSNNNRYIPPQYNSFTSKSPLSSFHNNINSIYSSEPLVNLELNTYYAGNSLYTNIGKSDAELNVGFSQSIGYSINQKHKIGIEVGNIGYSSSTIRMLPVASGVATDDGQSSGDNTPSPTILMPVKMSNHSDYIWGSVFYEHNLFQFNNFMLNGRIGIGGNKAGFMNLSRLVVSYKLLNSINVSFGVDNRLFFINDLYSGNSNKLINSLSLVYGIQFTL